MITVEQALEILRDHAPKGGAETVALGKAHHRILAEDVMAKNSMPPFCASNMDGYAIGNGGRRNVLAVIGESAAGRPFVGQVKPGEAVRIFTGAVMPSGADRVVIQENVELSDDSIRLKHAVKRNSDIRPVGSDFRSGERLLKARQSLSAGDITLAAAAGHSHLPVKKRLRIAIFETGDELRPVGETLNSGEIIAANSVGLAAHLNDWGAKIVQIKQVSDSLDEMTATIETAMDCDVIVTIGGASVGRHDIVRPAFKKAGFNLKFAGVALKPGKPSWFATRGNQVVLGLPGNPASAFVCSHLFLRPLLGLENRMMVVPISGSIAENGPREIYLRAVLKAEEGRLTAKPLPQQASSRLRPQSESNALIRVPPMGGPYKPGDRLEVISLTGGPALW